MEQPPPPETGEFRQGWPVVLAALLGIGLGLSPVPFYTIGVFAPVLAREFHWGMGQIQLGLLITTLAVIGSSAPVGLLADRFGVRPVALGSVVLFGLSFMTFSLSNGSLALYYATWAAVGVLGSGTLPITWTRAVNNRFERRKGAALGLSLVGSGVFGFVIKPLAALLIARLGWRGAYVAVGAMPLILALPVALAGFHDVGRRGGAGQRRVEEAASRRAGASGLSVAEALADWRFWVAAVAFVPLSFAVSGPLPNLEMILKLQGFHPADVISLTQVIGLSVIVGRLGGGWLIDRFWAPGVACVLLCAPALACWLLGHGSLGYPAAAASIALIGLAAGVEFDLLAFLVARYFGMKSYGLIYGALYAFFAIGAGVAPAVFGRVFDATHSYAGALDASAVLLVGGALMLLTLGRYRDFGAPAAPEVLMQAEMTADATPV